MSVMFVNDEYEMFAQLLNQNKTLSPQNSLPLGQVSGSTLPGCGLDHQIIPRHGTGAAYLPSRGWVKYGGKTGECGSEKEKDATAFCS